MFSALSLPRILDRMSDRLVMIFAATALCIGLGIMAALTASFQQSQQYWYILLAGWFVLGIAYSASVTPSGRLLRRSANAEDRPAVFAAQFALSHGCWLIAYPLAGQIGANFGQAAAFGALAFLAGIGVAAALVLWPADEASAFPHRHDGLPDDHPHIRDGHSADTEELHDFVIDDLHPNWPRS